MRPTRRTILVAAAGLLVALLPTLDPWLWPAWPLFLGGFALALAAGPEHGELYWVHFGTLERSDDFDLAMGSDKTIRTWSGPYDGWLEEAMATAADAVRQTLTVQIGRLRRVSIYATTPNGLLAATSFVDNLKLSGTLERR